ncbi:MAG: ABC transporter permease [Bdellovibrionota bacterium]|nr:ABC transporter permease [Bdellovibrionota bacterium]
MANVILVFKMKLFELLRQPSYVVGTMVFPSLFFLFFAQPNAKTPQAANLLQGSFAAYAFLGIIFFQFGVDLANEKSRAWFRFQKSLPISESSIFFGRILAALFFAFLTELLLILVINISTEVNISFLNYIKLSLYLCAASLPFAFLAISIGKLCTAKSALPISNMIYLSLSFLGGLWIPPNALPESIQKISEWMPTRYFVEMAWHFTVGFDFQWKSIAGLGSWGILFFLISLLASKISGKKIRL